MGIPLIALPVNEEERCKTGVRERFRQILRSQTDILERVVLGTPRGEFADPVRLMQEFEGPVAAAIREYCIEIARVRK